MSPRFVIQEHDSTHHHYDFRLEVDGILRSWVIPKGPSMNPADKRLALHVADHTIEYINFEGIIPEGQYGAGSVAVWDKGTYKLLEKKNDKIDFSLNGERIKVNFVLVYMKGRVKKNQWLLIKQKDKYACLFWVLKTSLTPEKKALLKERMPPCK